MTPILKRAMPFVITLMVGTGLGNIFGLNDPPSRTVVTSRTVTSRFTTVERHNVEPREFDAHHCGTQLKILYQPSTRFTHEAVKNQTTGVVTLLVRFNADGTTTVVDRLSTLPDGLTEDAERVAEQTRFTPATVEGKPVTETKEMNYIYTLNVPEIAEP